jgi:hypothetical protein
LGWLLSERTARKNREFEHAHWLRAEKLSAYGDLIARLSAMPVEGSAFAYLLDRDVDVQSDLFDEAFSQVVTATGRARLFAGPSVRAVLEESRQVVGAAVMEWRERRVALDCGTGREEAVEPIKALSSLFDRLVVDVRRELDISE